MSSPHKHGASDNFIAAVAYFSPIPAFFFLSVRLYNKRPYVRFHAWQSLVFSAFVFLFGVIMGYIVPFIRFLGPRVLLVLFCIACVVVFSIWLWCVIGAFRGKRCKLPVIGEWADEQAYR
jgi:uncharacterized membrane protein